VLRDAIINGPLKHPGANAVEDENGRLFFLDPQNVDKRRAYAETLLTRSLAEPSAIKKVYFFILIFFSIFPTNSP
jgi:DNA-directed RNA polymerase I subunit RPA1